MTTHTLAHLRASVAEMGPYLESQAEEADELGRLPEETVKRFKDAGIVRLLQPTDFGGLEASPVDFFETVLELGSHSGAAGWVASVVGVHPFEIAVADRRVQEEIWGTDPDTWVASPYAPFGRAREVEGGYIFSGRWSFSSGTDMCDWVILGGLIADEHGTPVGDSPERHFILPRSDYEIVADSWNVVGLKGTGSKDILIKDAFVPLYRVIDPRDLDSYEAVRRAGRTDSPLYRMPFNTMFGSAIAAGTLAIAVGAYRTSLEYTRRRVTARGTVSAQDPSQLLVLAEAGADIDASVLQFRDSIDRLWTRARNGDEIDLVTRVQARRDQVTAVHRAADAVDRLVDLAGGGAMRLDHPLQRHWRDLHTGLGHAANVADKVYISYGMVLFGHGLPPGARV